MCKYINKLAYIVLFYSRLPATTLSTSADFVGFGPVLVFSPRTWFTSSSVTVMYCHGNCRRFPVLPARHFIHTVVGRRAHQRLGGNIDQSCGCRGVWTAVGDNDPGSVGAPALLGSAVEPETSLQISEQQQHRRGKEQLSADS